MPTAEGTDVPRDGFGWAVLATLVDAVDGRPVHPGRGSGRQRHGRAGRGRSRWTSTCPVSGPSGRERGRRRTSRWPGEPVAGRPRDAVVEEPLPTGGPPHRRHEHAEDDIRRRQDTPVEDDRRPMPDADGGRRPAPRPRPTPRRAAPPSRRRSGVGQPAARRSAPRRCSPSWPRLEKDDPRRERLREILVEEHLPLVRHFARRFSNRGEPFDDLLQVGTLGLIAAIDRFDPTRGVEFLSFAVPTITGEIKRHFRDQGWSVRVPRRLQELHLSLNAAVGELAQKNGRAPDAVASWPSTWASRARRSSRGWPSPTPTAAARSTSGSPARTTPPPWPPPWARRTPRSRAWSTASRCSRCWPPSRPASAAS